jgi:hypothetical protein
MIVNFSSKGCQIFNESNCNIEGDVLASTLEIDGMYRLCLEREIAHVTVERQMQVLWHKRLGHLSLNGMKQLREEIAKHLDFSDQYICGGYPTTSNLALASTTAHRRKKLVVTSSLRRS